MIGFRSIEKETPEDIEWTYLPGHSFGMIGIRTSDDIWFLGDSYLSKSFLVQYPFGFIYNVGAYLETLERLKDFKGQTVRSISRDSREGYCRDFGSKSKQRI